MADQGFVGLGRSPLAPPIAVYKTSVYNAKLTKYCFCFPSEYIIVVLFAEDHWLCLPDPPPTFCLWTPLEGLPSPSSLMNPVSHVLYPPLNTTMNSVYRPGILRRWHSVVSWGACDLLQYGTVGQCFTCNSLMCSPSSNMYFSSPDRAITPAVDLHWLLNVIL